MTSVRSNAPRVIRYVIRHTVAEATLPDKHYENDLGRSGDSSIPAS